MLIKNILNKETKKYFTSILKNYKEKNNRYKQLI